jgi:hypothetical protein
MNIGAFPAEVIGMSFRVERILSTDVAIFLEAYEESYGGVSFTLHLYRGEPKRGLASGESRIWPLTSCSKHLALCTVVAPSLITCNFASCCATTRENLGWLRPGCSSGFVPCLAMQ